MFKRIIKSDAVRAFACWIAAQAIRFVFYTGKWEWVNHEIPGEYWENDKPFILAFWHNRIMVQPYGWPKIRKMNMLISQHRDGQLIAQTVGHLGIGTIRGSSAKPGKEDKDKGGAKALRAMVKALGRGESVGITPDGPRGPRMRATEGVVAVARLANVPIIPVAYSMKSRKLARSWDQFIIAKPFSKGAFVWGDPIFVARTDDIEAKRQEVEMAINWVSQQADNIVGVEAIEPAPLHDDTEGSV
jgi:lysophospholipid acyltransferase (LPLAT)-like uncharacterized protein